MNTFHRLLFVLLALALVTGCGSVRDVQQGHSTGSGQDAAVPHELVIIQTEDYSRGLLNRDEVIEAAKGVTLAKYPNADDVLVDDYILVRYEADGTSVTVDDTFMKILTEKGKRENESLNFHFTLPYSEMDAALVELIKPDGTVVPVDVAAQSRVMVDRSQMGSNIYNPNAKVFSVGVPGVEIGDIVRYVSVRKLVKPRVPNTWSDYQVLEYTSPIKRYVYEVSAPRELPLRRIALKAEAPGTVTHTTEKENGRIRYRWEVRDVPRMYKEPAMPPLHTVVQRLLVSTIPDWNTISQWYWNLSEPHFETTPEIRAKVKELTDGLNDRQAKIEAIFKFVSQDIRYMGITIEKEAPGYEPHDVRLTFEQRYGVCRDKAALLVAMLREAGFKAYPVLIHNGPKKDAEVPQPWFNHAVSAVEDEDGSYQLMDSTDESTMRLLPAYLSDKSFLVATPKGEPLITSPIVPAEKNLVRIETRARLNATGDLEADSTLHFEGINDNAYRGYFSRIKPEERRQFFQAVAKRVVAGAKLTELSITPADMLDTSESLTVRLRLEARDILVAGDENIMLPVIRWGARVGMVNFILAQTGLDQRKYPMVTELACGVRESFTLTLGNALGECVSLPEYEPIEDEAVAWKRKLVLDDGILQGSGEFLLKGVEFTPQQYLALKETLKQIEYNDRKMPIFSVPALPVESSTAVEAEADMVLLDSEVVYELDDAVDVTNWTETHTVRKKILTYAGKKNHSEIKLDYNPVWEDVKVEAAAVIGPDGARKEINADEINILDAAWVGAAPRYPAAKTMVVSLPGVEVGSVIEYRITRTKRNRPFFAARKYFNGFDPVDRKRVEVIFNMRTPLKVFQVLPEKAFSQSELDGGRRSNVWTLTDQPPVKHERNLPPWWSFNPKLFLSTGEWQTYVYDARNTLADAVANQPNVAAKAIELTGELAGPYEKMTVIRNFVAKYIRPVGPGINALPLSAITPADRTLADGYGNSADRAVVLSAMLAAAGFRPEFVLASQEREVAGLENPIHTFPDASVFGQVLVRVKVGDEVIYLNDTNQYAALGATPHDGLLGLDLTTGKVATIHAPEARQDRSEVDIVLRLSEDGDANITRTMRYYGSGFGAFHRRFAEMPPEERRRYHQEAMAGISQAATPDGDLVTNYDTYPGEESLAVKIKDFAVRDGDYLYFRLPATLARLMALRSDTRENPFYWSAPRRRVITIRVIMPVGFNRTLLAPPAVDWRAPGNAGGIQITSRQTDDRSMEISYIVDLDAAVIDARDYAELLNINTRLGHPEAAMVLLKKE